MFVTRLVVLMCCVVEHARTQLTAHIRTRGRVNQLYLNHTSNRITHVVLQRSCIFGILSNTSVLLVYHGICSGSNRTSICHLL